MKRVNFLLLLVSSFLLFLTTSCNVDDIPLSANLAFRQVSISDFFGVYDNGNYMLYLYATSFKDSSYDYSVSAVFYDQKYDSLIYAGNVNIDNLIIKYDDSSHYYNYYDNIKLQDTTPVYGKTSHWGWTGNSSTGMPPFDTSFYCAKLINITNIKNGDTLDLSSNLEIEWNSDFKNLKKIPIVFHFDSYGWYSVVSDSGYFKVPDYVMKYLRQSSNIKVDIGRESTAIFQIGDNKCSFDAVTVCSRNVFVK
jgi:hypothetical protein